MNYRFDSELDSPNRGVEPKFDDERTLLSARRVVPLEKIDAKVRHRRHWVLGGAFAVAMMLGAASALVASYLKLRNVQNAPAAVSKVDVPEAPVTVTENPPAEEPVADAAESEATPADEAQVDETSDTEELAEAESTPKKQAPVKHRTAPAPRRDDDMVVPSDSRGDNRRMSEDEQLHSIRDAVLYDEWQERRARRVWRRGRRRAERYNHRDLSNLDEIFEGRRRQNP